MEDLGFVWVAIVMLVSIATAVGLKIKPREGPTPLVEVFAICGAGAVAGYVMGYPLAIVPIGILALMEIAERWKR